MSHSLIEQMRHSADVRQRVTCNAMEDPTYAMTVSLGLSYLMRKFELDEFTFTKEDFDAFGPPSAFTVVTEDGVVTICRVTEEVALAAAEDIEEEYGS